MNTPSISRRDQIRNVALYAAMNCLVYLTAPVVYVGITQASLCARLGASDAVANLPTSAYFWAALVPVFVAARFHKLSATAPVLVAAYSSMAVGGLLVAASLWWPASSTIRLAIVILYGGTIGASMGVRNVFIWEVVNRGMAHDLRGWAYSMSFGLGPLFAVMGSLIAQLLLTGEVGLPWLSPSITISMMGPNGAPLIFPLNFAVLFAATVPLLGIAALLASRFMLPHSDEELPRVSVIAGLRQSASELTRDRILACAILAYVLVDAGFTISNNMSLYSIKTLQQPGQDFVGYQNAIRFTFKMSMGLTLGWLLVRTHAKLGALVTVTSCLAGVVWALAAPQNWFLVCFGLMGAGELYAVYYPNYIMSRSRPERLRQNMAMVQLLSLATGLAPAGFGLLSDAFGLPISFVAAGCILGASLALVSAVLPAKPTPPASPAAPALSVSSGGVYAGL